MFKINYKNTIRTLSLLFRRQTHLSKNQKYIVLGIETSCDDTGVALVNSQGIILGESLYSQQGLHLKYGGIIPPMAQDHHRKNIEKAVNDCMHQSNINFNEIDAIAVTNRPGLPMSLVIGLRYAKHLSRRYSKPIIPIHHMEAHALMARMQNDIPFPFLSLLISGGHSQLTLVKDVNDFYLLGDGLDDAPGEAFDKIARRLKLRNIPKYRNLNGGQAIELAAKGSENPDRFEFPLPLARMKDCQFSFAGLKNNAIRHLNREEQEKNVRIDEVIPDYKDFCAGFLKGITRHISNRTQRAIEFCLREGYFYNTQKSLVISGGVACNDFIFKTITNMANHYEFKTYRPTKKLCSDNGIMIAWNGLERILKNPKCLENIENIDDIVAIGKCSLGKSLKDEVIKANINCKWVQVKWYDQIEKIDNKIKN